MGKPLAHNPADTILSVQAPIALLERLDHHARARDLCRSQIVRQAIRRELERLEQEGCVVVPTT